MGLFHRDTIRESILMLECMHLDGKEKLIEGLRKIASEQDPADNGKAVAEGNPER